MIGRLIIGTFVALSVPGLHACAPSPDSEPRQPELRANNPPELNKEADLGLAELGKGNLALAETHFRNALEKDESDVYALLGLGILYQNAGQPAKAREMYDAVLVLRPGSDQMFVDWDISTMRPVSDIVGFNLALIDSGVATAGLDLEAASREPPSPPPKSLFEESQPHATPQTNSQPVVGTLGLETELRDPTKSVAALSNAARDPESMPPSEPADPAILSQAHQNILDRFQTLAALRDEWLITRAEFDARRQANLGALLPLTSPPPAAGLDQPAPTTGQIAGGLRTIRQALDTRAMTVELHASERSMILDAVLPADPVVMANPGLPPHALFEAGEAVQRLEALKVTSLITSDEYARERAALDAAMQPEPEEAGMWMAGNEPNPEAIAEPSATPKKPTAEPPATPTRLTPKAAANPPASPKKPEPELAAKPPAALDKLSAKPTSKPPATPKTPAAKTTDAQPSVHLASYRSIRAAERGWSILREAHEDLLGDLSIEVSPVNLGVKGDFYRLKAGPLVDKAAARGLCRELKKRRQYCEPSG